jgi:molecular chaperone DnaJ
LLIATGRYQSKRLRRLRSPVQDARQLSAVLEDPAVGGFRVSNEIDKPHYDISQSIERFFQNRSPGDLLLVHLSCHGIKDNDGLLYFAASNTNPDLPASTSISAEFLRNQLLRSRAKSIVLLLDCCYSGSFLTGMKGDENVDIREELAGHGRAVITATSRTEYAWEGDGLVEFEPEPSRFTGAIVSGLRTGDADLDGDGKIAVDELYDYVFDQLHRAKARQTPRKWADLEYRVFVATAAKRSARQPPLDKLSVGSTSRQLGSRQRRGRNATVRVELSLTEAAFGTVRDLILDTAIRCAECGGTGSAQRDMPTGCRPCRGYGQLNRIGNQPSPCKDCEGYGTVITSPCPNCLGDGRVRFRRTIKVRIPAGVEHGTHIELAGEGEVGPLGGPEADLYLEIVQLDDPRFERRGDDLYCSATIPRAVAGSGGTVQIETLEGPKDVRIRAGVTSGTTLRIAGAGVPHLNLDADGVGKADGSGRGDLMVRVSLAD